MSIPKRMQFTKPGFLTVLTLSFPWAGMAQADPLQEARPRSVVFYLIDTCRNDRLGSSGYERDTTPFLEWLAERSVTFAACYSQAPWTKPSMASMLTSRYPTATGVKWMNQRLPQDFVTWPEVLDANGYFTAGFSANIVMGDLLSSFGQGFDHFIESTEINQGDPIHFASGSAKRLNEHVFPWLERTDHWPMLLYLHSVDPHEEYEPAQPYLEQFADPQRHPRYREEWQALLKSRPPIPGLYVTQDNFDRTGIDSASFIEHGSNLYDGDVRANDQQLKFLWDQLQQDGWGEEFVFVFTSDHGEEFFEHGGTSHGYSLYEEMLRVPLMIYAPGLLPGGKRVTQPVESLDIYPTLCELLGLETPQGLEGESLVPLILGTGEPGEGSVFFEHTEDPVLRSMEQGSGVMAGVREGRWKLIVNEVGSQLLEKPRLELFDLETDPGEQHNVAAEHPTITRRLEAEVQAFVATQRAAAPKVEGRPLEGAAREQLQALGYGGGAEDTPDLWTAIHARRIADVRRSLEAGADPDQLEPVTGVRPLSISALLGSVRLTGLLLDHGAGIDARNVDGSTPLMSAAFLGRTSVLQLLLKKGADRNLKNSAGDTAVESTQVPWGLTLYIASLLQLELDRPKVEEGRRRCAELLKEDG